jgi:transmembrane sensor
MKSIPERANRQIRQEATHWFVDFRTGDIDAARSEAFRRWLQRSPEHIRAYLKVTQSYVGLPAPNSDAGELDIDSLIERARADTRADVIAFARESQSANVTSPARPAPAHRMRHFAAAAAVVMLLCTLGIGFFSFQENLYSTGVDEQRSIVLPDGSTVELNASSQLRVRYSESERRIDLLSGQALFRVAKDEAHPFIVQTDRAHVRAVGTEFDVYRKRIGTVVTVVEGRVAVSAAESPADSARAGPREMAQRPADVLLSAGEQLVVGPRATDAPRRADLVAATSWTARQLVFHGNSLLDVAEEFNRYSSRRLVIEQAERLADFHVTGTFSSTSADSLIRFLRAEPGIEVLESEGEIRIRPTSQ